MISVLHYPPLEQVWLLLMSMCVVLTNMRATG